MNTLLQNPNQGQIQTCLHCGGTGHCNALHEFYRRPGQFLPRWQTASCFACRIKAGLSVDQQYGDLACSVCHGKGMVWVGPEIFPHN